MSDDKPEGGSGASPTVATPEAVAFLQKAIASSFALWAKSPPKLSDAYREATWGDPGYQPQQSNLVGFGKASAIDWQASQLVLVKPRWVTYRLASPLVTGNGIQTHARAGRAAQWQRIHGGIYDGSETAPLLIAKEVLEAHVHEEQVEPIAKRVDAIQLQMPDGAFRVFRREGTILRELKVRQPKGPIVRGLSPGRAE